MLKSLILKMNNKVYDIIKNIFIKFFLFFLIINIIIDENFHKKEFKNLEDYYCQSICKFLYFTTNYNCSSKIFINKDFYEDALEINSNIDLLIDTKLSKLENIFLLVGIIPFLKNNSSLSYKINNKEIYNFFKKFFKNSKNEHNIIKFGYTDFNTFNENLNELLNYKWELIPEKYLLDNLRYVINNYYNETNFDSYQNLLNINYNFYFQKRKKEITFKDLESLLSKCYY